MSARSTYCRAIKTTKSDSSSRITASTNAHELGFASNKKFKKVSHWDYALSPSRNHELAAQHCVDELRKVLDMTNETPSEIVGYSETHDSGYTFLVRL